MIVKTTTTFVASFGTFGLHILWQRHLRSRGDLHRGNWVHDYVGTEGTQRTKMDLGLDVRRQGTLKRVHQAVYTAIDSKSLKHRGQLPHPRRTRDRCRCRQRR